MDSHCHDDVIQFLIIVLRIFLVARYRAVGIVTRVTCAPQSKCYKKKPVQLGVRHVEGKSPTTLQGCDKILEALSAGSMGNATKTAPLLASTLKTTAQFGSCNQASHTTSQLIHLVRKIACPLQL
jgi:hypothetical protein